jgi:hypothetical protein
MSAIRNTMSAHETVDWPEILIKEDFLPGADGLFAALERDIAWESRIKKRKTASFGVPFNYSGITYEYCDMHPLLVPVCDKLENEVGYRPNNCLLNYYETGSATMGFHVDATDDLTPGTGVAIVSLGSERSITFRNIENRDLQKDYRLKSGSLLYMPHAVQEHWRHAVLKEPGAGPRISLTFRQVVSTIPQ